MREALKSPTCSVLVSGGKGVLSAETEGFLE